MSFDQRYVSTGEIGAEDVQPFVKSSSILESILQQQMQ